MNVFFLHQTPSLIIGALAFLLTALDVVLSFPLFFRTVLTPNNRGAGLLIFYLVVRLSMHAGWLIYLWPLASLFVILALILEIIASLIFLLHSWQLRGYWKDRDNTHL